MPVAGDGICEMLIGPCSEEVTFPGKAPEQPRCKVRGLPGLPKGATAHKMAGLPHIS